jgi:hypothetical protein
MGLSARGGSLRGIHYWVVRIALRVGLASLGVLLAACSSGPSTPAYQSPSPPLSTSPASSRATGAEEPELAVWPETARSVLPGRFPRWRTSAAATTTHFAIKVLGWPRPLVHPIDSRFHVERGVRTFAVRPHAGMRWVEVHSARIFDKRHWSVTYLWGFGRHEPGGSVSITRHHADVASGYWGRSSSALLRLIYGGHSLDRVSTTAAQWSVPLTFPINVNGAIMILFRNSTGQVYTGWATPVRAGPFAAG